MDRISALRNIEDALAAFEDGDVSLQDLERRVQGTLRTYATDFEGELAAYRASGESRVDGMIVVATSERAARERIAGLLSVEPGTLSMTVERAAASDEPSDG
jgi:hypothetical protein